MTQLSISQIESKIGAICMRCAQIDSICISLIRETLQCDVETCAAIVQSADMPVKRFELWKRLCYTDKAPADLREAASALSKVAQAIMERRNRLIHDDIRFEQDTFYRVDARAQIKDTPNGKSLHFNVKHAMSAETIDNFIRILDSFIDILAKFALSLLLGNSLAQHDALRASLDTIPSEAQGLLTRLSRLPHP